MYLLFLSLAILAAFPIVYRVWVRPMLAVHFGQEPGYRRDRQAALRLQRFENRCTCGFGCTLLGGVVNLLSGSVLPKPGGEIWAIYILILSVGSVAFWAAWSRFHQPFRD